MTTLNFDATKVAPSVVKEEKPRVWSDRQLAIFHFAQHGQGNAVVVAVAGSGKSTTLIEAYNRLRGQGLFLAFNKAIADELKAKGVNARTFHSLGYGAVMNHVGCSSVEMNKMHKLCTTIMNPSMYDQLSEEQKARQPRPGEMDFEYYSAFAKRLCGLAKQGGIGAGLLPDTEQKWMDICVYHDIEPENENADLGRAIEWARALLDASNDYRKHKMIDFDDMLYIPIRDGLSLPKYDFVFVDEAQDTNMIQRALLRKVMKPRSRLIAVGDPAQAIYGFRGADSDSLDILAREFGCIELPLDITYRCPESVVRYAHQWVSHIKARPGAPEGIVENHGLEWKSEMFQPDDLIVCRTTKPLVELAYKMLRLRQPCRVLGKEIGQGLKSVIKKMNADTVDELLLKLDAWAEREIEKAMAKNLESKAESIHDKRETIAFLVDGLEEGNRTINEIYRVIDLLFADTLGVPMLSTIHKSKGLEAERVFWLNRSQCPPQWIRGEWQKQQELNLCYVATTRAKSELHIIENPQER